MAQFADHRKAARLQSLPLRVATVAIAATLPLAGVALAQSVAQSSSTKADIASFKGNPQTLIRAIRHIEQASGGRVIDIRYTSAGDMSGYQAVVAKDGQINFFRVEHDGGNVLTIDEKSTPVWMLSWRGKADVRFADHAPVPLTAAITTAEKAYSNSPAVAAGIARSASNPESTVHAYNVLLDIQGSARRVAVDDSTGQIIEDPQALSDEP